VIYILIGLGIIASFITIIAKNQTERIGDRMRRRQARNNEGENRDTTG
jgi:hypothetical protein